MRAPCPIEGHERHFIACEEPPCAEEHNQHTVGFTGKRLGRRGGECPDHGRDCESGNWVLCGAAS